MKLEKLRFFAFHGFYAEENILGTEFLVDVSIEKKDPKATTTWVIPDEQTVYWFVKFEMQKTSKLLEDVNNRIKERIQKEIPANEKDKFLVKIAMRKVNPPFGEHIEYTYVDTEGKIGIENAYFHAHWGGDADAAKLGNSYRMNLWATVPPSVKDTDNIVNTLNYEVLYRIIQTIVRKPIKDGAALMGEASKLLTGLNENVQKIELELEQIDVSPFHQKPYKYITSVSYEKECAKCKAKMLCYNDSNCWCKSIRIVPATADLIKKQFKGCLCQKCLKFYEK